ncbi:MAG: hypothetical protein EAZ85_10055 [Bacteroidetes bacterium]|nr:MAG: hypothetical protein EAZ85_10055 [Bacteroidota bacterium]TAG88724.1 MAG: hypothetical protein EAZ20_07910 [Bacteroidota bacterium]
MAYNHFSLSDIDTKFNIKHRKISFLPNDFKEIIADKRLLDELSDAIGMPLASEKAKSELIVKPVLMALRRNNIDKISIFSGYTFDVDKEKKLMGRCDFMIANEPYLEEVTSPMFCMVEAKKDALEDGFGQCAAELYATKIFNERKNIVYPAIYGCITTGFSWVFLKLENNIILIEPFYIPLELKNPNKILSVLQWIVEQYQK